MPENETWSWSEEQQAFLCGERHDGAGVYLQNEKWYGNVVVGERMVPVGPCDDKERAVADCEQELAAMRKFASE